jgi:hypothetical protein
MESSTPGRILMLVGLVVFLIGGVLYLTSKAGLPLGKLPGDFTIQRGNLTCFFPLASMIIISLLLTLLINLAWRFFNR